MKKKSLRILSLIVAIVMVVAMLPLSALAEETGPKRKVGVVVYGAELTAILTNIDKSIKDGVSSIENGDAEAAVENTKNSLETLVELASMGLVSPFRIWILKSKMRPEPLTL